MCLKLCLKINFWTWHSWKNSLSPHLKNVTLLFFVRKKYIICDRTLYWVSPNTSKHQKVTWTVTENGQSIFSLSVIIQLLYTLFLLHYIKVSHIANKHKIDQQMASKTFILGPTKHPKGSNCYVDSCKKWTMYDL